MASDGGPGGLGGQLAGRRGVRDLQGLDRPLSRSTQTIGKGGKGGHRILAAISKGQGRTALGHQDAGPVGIGKEGHGGRGADKDHQIHPGQIAEGGLTEILHPARLEDPGTPGLTGDEGVGDDPITGGRQTRGLDETVLQTGPPPQQDDRLGRRLQGLGHGINALD